MSELKKVACQWMSKNKFGDIIECGELPTKPAKRCGFYYCSFHYEMAKTFKPFEQPAK